MYGLLLGVVTADVPLTPENVRPGWIAMPVVGVLIVATVLLLRSFVKHPSVLRSRGRVRKATTTRRADGGQNGRYITCRPTGPFVGWMKAPGTVPMISKPNRWYSATAGWSR